MEVGEAVLEAPVDPTCPEAHFLLSGRMPYLGPPSEAALGPAVGSVGGKGEWKRPSPLPDQH